MDRSKRKTHMSVVMGNMKVGGDQLGPSPWSLEKSTQLPWVWR